MRITTTVLTALLFIWPAGALADDRPSQLRYSLKEDAPVTGSSIKRDIVSDSAIPLDRRYSELTPEQQTIVKSQYERMGPNDEPPFPANGLRPLFKALIKGQETLLVEGPLSLLVEIDSQGQATSVSVFQSPDPQLTQFAAAVLMLERYKPALCDGIPCTMQFPFRVMFTKRL